MKSWSSLKIISLKEKDLTISLNCKMDLKIIKGLKIQTLLNLITRRIPI